MVKYSAKLEPIDRIKKKVLKGLRDSLNATLFRAANIIRVQLRNMIADAIKSTPEYSSIDSGLLEAELGLPDGGSRLDKIIDVWVNTIEVIATPVRFARSGGKITGGIRVMAIEKDWSSVIKLPESTLITAKGTPLEWLRWMLLEGTNPIIKNYKVVRGSFSRRQSRTGKAIMIRSGKGDVKNWKVPTKFDNNFVTRALDEIEPLVEDMIIKIILQQVR